MKDADLNWETALDVASRWEAANDFEDIAASTSSSLEDDVALEAIEFDMAGKKFQGNQKELKGRQKYRRSSCWGQIQRKRYQRAEERAKRSDGDLTTWRDETNETLRLILEALQVDGACPTQSGELFSHMMERINDYRKTKKKMLNFTGQNHALCTSVKYPKLASFLCFMGQLCAFHGV